MPLPHFLIIGAMKAGTTTLYRDLLTNPAVFMPIRKEPHSLCDDAVLSDQGCAEYAALFSGADESQICGEASTGYTKLPDYPDVPKRARSVLGENLKLIYLVREPIARVVSHHYHSVVSGLFKGHIDQVVRDEPRLLNYTRYAMQIEPWIDTFGFDHVRIIKFERYIADRVGVVEELSNFLGIQPALGQINPQAVYNKTENKPVATKLWTHVARSGVYRKCVRPLLPLAVKDRIRAAALPKAPPPPPPPSEQTKQFIYDELTDDMERLRILMGSESPIWTR